MIDLAGCVIRDQDGRILLLHRNTEKFSHWELPGGKVEENESPKSAAAREIREELQLGVKIVRKLGEETFSDLNGQYNYHWYLADIAHGTPQIGEPDKFDDLGHFHVAEMPNLELSANMKKLHRKLALQEITF